MSNNLELGHMRELRRGIEAQFDKEECRTLAFDLQILWGNLAGETLKIRIQQLILYLQRRGRLADLMDLLIQERPDYDWPVLASFEEPGAEENIEQRLKSPRAVATPLRVEPLPVEEARSEAQIQHEHQVQQRIDKAQIHAIAIEEEISAETDQANDLAANDQYAEAAGVYAKIAKRLAANHQPARSRVYAKRSAELFRSADNKQAAADQLIRSAKIWIDDTSFDLTIVLRDLRQAETLAIEIRNFTFQARTLLMQSWISLMEGDIDQAEELWKTISDLLPKVLEGDRVDLLCELSLQRAMKARLDENWQEAREILQEADERDWPDKIPSQRLELLRVRLFLEAEAGDWEATDHIYERIRQRLATQGSLLQDSEWLMHYAATLARRGAEEKAFKAYMKALDGLEDAKADISLMHHFYQDMLHMLRRHVDYRVSGPIYRYESRRLDLLRNILNEVRSFQYVQKARQSYFEGDLVRAVHYGESAQLLAWQEGSWANLGLAHKTLVTLYSANNQPMEAILAAVRAGEDKALRRLAAQTARTFDKEKAPLLIASLMQDWPSLAELRSALTALVECSDMIPPEWLGEIITHSVAIVVQSHGVSGGRELCRRAIELLRDLVPQMNREQTEQVTRFCIEHLSGDLFWTIKEQLVKLLGNCFANRDDIDTELYQLALDSTQPLGEDEALKGDVEWTLVNLGMKAPARVREQIATYFYERSDWQYLAILGERLSEKRVKIAIRGVLRAITPSRSEEGSISFSGIKAQSILNFNELLTPALYGYVVDGLLAAIANPDGFYSQQAGAAITLRWLPDKVVRKSAERIADALLDVANEKGQIPSVQKVFGGSAGQVHQGCLYTLGHLYRFVSQDTQVRIIDQVVSASDSDDMLWRTGSAMALRLIRGPRKLPQSLAFTVEKLLLDSEPEVRHWAGAATGHLVAKRMFSNKIGAYFIVRLNKLVGAENDALARAGLAFGLLQTVDREEFNDLTGRQRVEVVEQLERDVSHRVRRMASTWKRTNQV